MTYTIRYTKTLDVQFMRDVMTTMIESGEVSVWYWANAISIDRVEDLSVTRIELEEAGVDDAERVVIDGDRIVAAMSDILDGKANLAHYIVKYIRDAVATDDAGCIDAEAADAIAQWIVCGEIRYG